jgi:hypothetical protein
VRRAPPWSGCRRSAACPDRDVQQPAGMREQVPGLGQLAAQRWRRRPCRCARRGSARPSPAGRRSAPAPGSRRPRPRHQVLRVAAVAHDVELVPEGRGGRGARTSSIEQIDTVDSQKARRPLRPRAPPAPRRGAPGAGQAERGEHQRQRQVLAQHAGGEASAARRRASRAGAVAGAGRPRGWRPAVTSS